MSMDSDIVAPSDLLYTRFNVWCRPDGLNATLGITFSGARNLGTVSSVTDLPSVGDYLPSGKTRGTITGANLAFDFYSSVSGTVTDVNSGLADSPGLINTDPYGDGWIFKVQVNDDSVFNGMLTPEEYYQTLGPQDW
jgi:glycine cleavage system H protein